MTNLIFIGPPGSGKGTQASILMKKGYQKISAGDLLRSEVLANSKLGKEIDSYIKEGNLVPDELICNVVSEAISFYLNKDSMANLIFDGFPRRATQAEKLSNLLGQLRLKIDAVVNFEISEKVLYQRISNRRVCEKCQSSFNLKNDNFVALNECPQCGGKKFFTRSDDTKKVFDNRMSIYKQESATILGYYNNFTKIFKVESDNEISEIADRIENFLMSI